MSRTRFVNVRFDLSNPDDALTYTRLKESSRRASRSSIALQARYLLRVMLGVRMFESIERTGLTEVPNFPAQAKAFEALLGQVVKNVAARQKKEFEQEKGNNRAVVVQTREIDHASSRVRSGLNRRPGS